MPQSPLRIDSDGKRPRILLINQFFWPDSAPTGVLLEDVARELVTRGCDVTVLCGSTSYLDASNGDCPPVRIVRIPALPYSRGTVGRMMSWLSFLIFAAVRTISMRSFDLVVTLTSPPGLSLVGSLLKLFRRSRFWIWEMDLYPDVAVAVGALRHGSVRESLIRKAMTRIRAQADGIIALGECMRSRLIGHGLNPAKIFIAENWADNRLINPRPFPSSPPLTVLYSGNLGLAHETDTIAEVMLRLRDCDDIRFIFVGAGPRRADLQEFCALHKIGNVTFESYVDRGHLSESLGRCHVGLTTLRPECAGTVVPSKLYSFLAAGRPFLFVGPRSALPAHLFERGCGWHIEPGDARSALRTLQSLAADYDSIAAAGLNARRTFSDHYDVAHGAHRVADLLVQ